MRDPSASRRPVRPRGRSDGQASAEYVAVLAVIALVLVVGGALAAAPAIANGVGSAFGRALCQVTGQGCATVAPSACTVATTGTEVTAGAELTLVRVGASTGLLRSTRSDGTVELTLLDHVDGSLVAGIGASGRLELGGREVGGGALAEAALVARLGGGRVWTVPSAAAADRLQRRLVEVLAGRAGAALPGVGGALAIAQHLVGRGIGRRLPAPTARVLAGRLAISAALDGPLASEIRIAAGVALGGRVTTSGGYGLMVELDGAAGAHVAGGLAGLDAEGKTTLGLTLDARGRPTELTASATGRLGGALLARGAPGGISSTAASGQAVDVTATLDLTVPAHAAAAARLLRALAPARRGDLPGAASALGAVMARGGRIDVARYDTREQRYGAGGHAALGAAVGAELQLSRRGTRLLDAWTRPPGGVWEQRADCLRA